MPAQNRVWSDQALAAQRSGQPLDEGDEDRPLPSSGTVVGWCGAGWLPRAGARRVRRPWWRTCGPSAGQPEYARRSSSATAATRWDHAQPAITAGQRPRPDFWHPTGGPFPLPHAGRGRRGRHALLRADRCSTARVERSDLRAARTGATLSTPPKDVFSYNAPSPAPSLGFIPSTGSTGQEGP